MKFFRYFLIFLMAFLTVNSCQKEPKDLWKTEIEGQKENIQITDISKEYFDANTSTEAFKQKYPWFQGTVSDADFDLRRKDAEEIKKACADAGVKLGVGFLMRFHGYHQKIKEIIAEGKIGDIVSMRGQFTCWYPDIEGAWRQKKALSGGGALVDMGIHVIDLLQYLSGLEAREVVAFNETQTFNYEVDDSSAVIMKMSNGSLAYIDSYFNIPDAASVAKLEIYGTKGSIIASGTLAQEEVGTVKILISDDSLGYDANQVRNEIVPLSLDDVELGNMYTKEVEQFGEAYLNNTEVPVTADSAILSQKVVEAAYKSSETKTFVAVK